MNEYLSDKEQIELFKKWWKDYGQGIALAVIVGLALGFAWRYWHAREIQNEALASSLYQQALFFDEKGDLTRAAQNSAKLSEQFPSSPYAALSALLVAKDAVANNNLTLALVKLNGIIAHTKEARFRQIARIRAARIFIEQKQFGQALSILAPVEDKAFMPMIAEVRGDIFLAQGRKVEAEKEYEEAKKAMQDAGVQDPFLQMKIAG